MQALIQIDAIKLDVDIVDAVNILAVSAIGIIQQRVLQGKDIKDRPFKPYERSYARGLKLLGMSTDVDLTLSGGLLQSLNVHTITRTNIGARAVIGVDNASSRYVPVPTGNVVNIARFKRNARKRASRVNVPAHSVLAEYIQNGTERTYARPWLGISPRDRSKLEEVLARMSSKIIRVT